MDEPHLMPHTWAKDAWTHERLQVLVPAAAGLALGHLALALLGLRSAHTVFLFISIGSAAYAAVGTLAFLYQLSSYHAMTLRLVLTEREAQGLFLPIIVSVVVYGIIAPNMVLGIIFACVSIPHALMLVYMVRTYAAVVPAPAHAPRTRATREHFQHALMRIVAIRTFRKTPDFTSR